MNRWANFMRAAALALIAAVLLLSPSAQSRTASSRAPSAATPQAHPPPASPAPRGIQSYRRFHANDSFIGKSILCSDEEKICFRYNTLYDPENGHCVFSPDNLHCVGNKLDFLQGSGRLHADCPPNLDPCPGHRMAFDGRCYPKQLVRDVLCGCPAPPTAHFLGGVECRCAPPARQTVRQPTQRGRCLVPDLRFPDTSYRDTPLRRIVASPDAFKLPCSPEQKRCFSLGKVWVARAMLPSMPKGDCFPLGQRGPCHDGQVVTLQKHALATVSAVCRLANGGCANGSFLMAFDGKCHEANEMEILDSSPFWRNFFGEFEIGFYNTFTKVIPIAENASCFFGVLISQLVSGRPDRQFPKISCANSNSGLCSVEAEAPLPN